VNDILLNALDRLIAGLGDIPLVTDRRVVRRRSRDFILNEQLDGKSADLIVSPRDERDVIRAAAVCARHRVPITVRAGGTGNHGQAVPLKGGVLLDVGFDRYRASETAGTSASEPMPSCPEVTTRLYPGRIRAGKAMRG
jgi:FAD/FMN-containing dehydrogenase